MAVAGSGVGNRAMSSPDGITWTSQTSASDNTWQAVTFAQGIFVAVSSSGAGNRVMTSTGPSSYSSDPETWVVIAQSLPLSANGTCQLLDDSVAAYGTTLTGGWMRSWQPWVNPTLGPDGQRIGGWGCIRTMINKGNGVWEIAN